MNFTKIVTLSFLAIMLFFSAANSQTKLAIGIEGGVNLANTMQTPDYTTNSRTGFIVGTHLDIGFGNMLVVTPTVRFIQKGRSSTDFNGEYVAKFSYLEVGALLKTKFSLTEVKPYLFAGPVIAFQLSATEDIIPVGGTSTNYDVSSNVESTEFSLMFGAGTDFKVSQNMGVFAQFGYSIGLSNILKNQPTATLKTNGIQITGGVKFNL